MERRKNNIIRKESQRQLLTVLCLALLGGLVIYATGGTVRAMFGDVSKERNSVRAEVRQKSIRYRFRRIYNGGDVMTAPHASGGPSVPVYKGVSRQPASVSYQQSAISHQQSAGGYAGINPSLSGSPHHSIIISGLQSQQRMQSYGGGGGMSGGGSNNHQPSAVSYQPSSGGYAGIIPSLSGLPHHSIIINGKPSAVSAQPSAVSAQPAAAPAKRRVTVYNPQGEDYEGDDDTESIDLNDLGGVDQTAWGLTFHWNDEAGAWEYVQDGSTFRYNSSSGMFELVGEDIPENFEPVGEVPVLLMLLLAGVFACIKRRKIGNRGTDELVN